jgi:hypothetical protein
MEALRSPKITIGFHCSQMRTKRMYVAAVVDPDEAKFYDPYEASAYWCVDTHSGFGPDGQPVRPDVCCGGRGCCKV